MSCSDTVNTILDYARKNPKSQLNGTAELRFVQAVKDSIEQGQVIPNEAIVVVDDIAKNWMVYE